VTIPAGSEPAPDSESAKAGDHSPLAQRGRKRCFCSALPNRRIGSVLDHQDQRARSASPGDLLDRHVHHQRAGPCAAVLGLERKRKQIVLGEQPAQIPRVGCLLVDLRGARRHAIHRDPADRVADLDHLGGQRVGLAEHRHDLILPLAQRGSGMVVPYAQQPR
jgi:hypothetical protein